MRTLCCFLTVLATFCSASTADAQVRSVEVPPTAFVGIDALVRVKGGPCGAVEINYGDPAAQEPIVTYTIQSGTLTPAFEKLHKWENEGVFTVKATGQGNCTGTATAVVKVVTFKIAPLPRITGYFGLARPGGVAGIVGKNFGTTKGGVTATLKDFNGEPLVIEFDPDDNIPEWKPGLVGIRWPDVSGVRAQTATLRVKVGNKTTNAWTVAFVPELEFKLLPQADVKVGSCSFDANKNLCNQVKDTNACALGVAEWAYVDPWPGNTSLFGWHSNCPAAVGDDAGTDTFHITLKNDWVLESFEFDVDKSGDDGDYVKAPIPAFPRGATKWSPSVKWLASADDEVTYEGQIMISGPKGVPHK